MTANLQKICPEATFTCSAVDLPSTSLRWFFNGNEFVHYTFIMNDMYPVKVEPTNATFNNLLGGVDIQILEASINRDNPDRANFLSTMTVNVASVQNAGISIIDCGTFAIKTNISVRQIGWSEN